MHKERLILLVSIILVAAFARILPHPVNMTPVAAVALFAGAYLPRLTLALIIPVAAMVLSDMLIGFHSTMLFVYAAMMLTACIGTLLRGKTRLMNVAGASLISSVLFFLITNFGTWMTQDMYPHTMEGLVACFVAALPFFTNTVLGDLFFTALLFGMFTIAERCFPKLQASGV